MKKQQHTRFQPAADFLAHWQISFFPTYNSDVLWISFELIIVYYYHLNLFSSTTALWLWLLPTATTNTYPQILYNSISRGWQLDLAL